LAIYGRIDAKHVNRKSHIVNFLRMAKRIPPASGNALAGGLNLSELGFFLFLRGERFLRGGRFGGALLEFVHATGRVHEFLLPGVKGMAHVANAHDNRGLGGTGFDDVAAGATNLGVHIFRMNVRLHKIGRTQ
jgi:hypothetical protein